MLWGGLVRDRVNLVRMVGLKEPEEVVAAVRPTYEQGVRAFKVKVGDGAQRDIDRVRRLARAYPDVADIDANGALRHLTRPWSCAAVWPTSTCCASSSRSPTGTPAPWRSCGKSRRCP